ncbi:luciferin sulfotransferase-like [Bradysia coprophila]|uniref:luciferin sulfotransferase-like n=1 Tax=Bradysia coprophila TaxID=38358 RepID=UPI00187D70E5|nr:luciferin sulfotransferase-like [Bradysia coprophila]
MSYSLEEFKGSPFLGDEMNELLSSQFTVVTASEKFISELPECLSNLKESVKLKPCIVLKEICELFMEAILDFDIRSDDVFVCSLPKCGSSWMQTIVWLLTHDLNYEAIKKINRSNQVGDFDELLNGSAAKEISAKLLADNKSLSESDALKMGWNEVFKLLDEPRVIKTHYPAYFLPRQIWSKGARVIYVVRNPKDMAVSLYYMLRNFFLADITIDDIVNGFTNETCCYSPHIDHALEFWRLRHLPNVLFVAYEDAVNHSFKTIKKVSEFLNCSYSDEQLNELTEFVSFGNMKKIQSINREADVAEMERLRGKKRPDAEFTFLRKGKPGGYGDDLSAEHIKKLDSWIETELHGTDFEFNMGKKS